MGHEVMALTLETEQKLERAGLIDFFEKERGDWGKMASRTYAHLKEQYPPKARIRHDDVAKILLPILEAEKSLTDFLSGEQLRQKYWYRHFTDLIIDRCWAELSSGQPVTEAEE